MVSGTIVIYPLFLGHNNKVFFQSEKNPFQGWMPVVVGNEQYFQRKNRTHLALTVRKELGNLCSAGVYGLRSLETVFWWVSSGRRATGSHLGPGGSPTHPVSAGELVKTKAPGNNSECRRDIRLENCTVPLLACMRRYRFLVYTRASPPGRLRGFP